MLLARGHDELERAARGIRGRGGSAEVLAVDLGDTVAARERRSTSSARAGACLGDRGLQRRGVSLRRSLRGSSDRPQDLARTMGVIYAGPVTLLRAARARRWRTPARPRDRRHLDERPGARPRLVLYGGSKAAMDAWLRAGRARARPERASPSRASACRSCARR